MVMLIGVMGLHTGKGGFLRQCDLKHISQKSDRYGFGVGGLRCERIVKEPGTRIGAGAGYMRGTHWVTRPIQWEYFKYRRFGDIIANF